MAQGDVPERRAVREETGLREFEIGPEVWSRAHDFDFDGQPIRQRERYFWVPTPRFEPDPQGMPEETERDWFRGFRWWRDDEIRASSEPFAPSALGARLGDLLDGPLPAKPLEIEV